MSTAATFVGDQTCAREITVPRASGLSCASASAELHHAEEPQAKVEAIATAEMARRVMPYGCAIVGPDVRPNGGRRGLSSSRSPAGRLRGQQQHRPPTFHMTSAAP